MISKVRIAARYFVVGSRSLGKKKGTAQVMMSGPFSQPRGKCRKMVLERLPTVGRKGARQVEGEKPTASEAMQWEWRKRTGEAMERRRKRCRPEDEGKRQVASQKDRHQAVMREKERREKREEGFGERQIKWRDRKWQSERLESCTETRIIPIHKHYSDTVCWKRT